MFINNSKKNIYELESQLSTIGKNLDEVEKRLIEIQENLDNIENGLAEIEKQLVEGQEKLENIENGLADFGRSLEFIIENSFPKAPDINKVFVKKNGLISTPKRNIFEGD